MNENWNSSGGPPVESVEQNQQPQLDFSTVANQNQPHHSRTTPDRSIVMKTESVENECSDSHVSSGIYESSSSENRSSESPRSSPYSVQENYQNVESPMDCGMQLVEENPEPELVVEDQMDVVSSSTKPRREKPAPRSNRFEYECPICLFKSSDRDGILAHLAIHYNPNRIEGEPEVPRTLEIPGLSFDQIAERIAKHEEDINYPIINAQGKVKKHVCKYCPHIAVTKVEFWRHGKTHLKPEKILYCRYCPFVTDLKHHYEYHMNKQTGAKPFACKECQYKCVNKSMLSSHMKSHTDLRQFSCADCAYVTKYCHSLKMHLRKYCHKPGPILNPDGTLNLVSTIDVYGTRRGPKQKKIASTATISTVKITNAKVRTLPKDALKRQNSNNNKNSNNIKANHAASPPPPPPLPPPPPPQLMAPPQMPSPNENPQMMMSPIMNPMGVVNPFSGTGLNSLLAMQYNNILRRGFPTVEPYMINNDEINARNMDQIRANLVAEYLLAAERLNASNLSQEPLNYYSPLRLRAIQSVADVSATQYLDVQQQHIQHGLEVLDLSRGNCNDTSNISFNNVNYNNINNNNNNNNNNSVKNCEIDRIDEHQRLECSTPTSTSTRTPSGTSRRKGRAVKLNRREIKQESDGENQIDDRNMEHGTSESGESSLDPDECNNQLLKCNYCPISFGDDAMYTIHMGYHGYKDPYTCNMCGQKCEDALSFNIHLSRSKHV